MEDGLIAAGGRRDNEPVLGGFGSLNSGVPGSGSDFDIDMNVCLLFKESRDGIDEVDDA